MPILPLAAYAEALKPWLSSVSGDLATGVAGISRDSRKAAAGILFCAIRGAKIDSHLYLDEAAAKGACAFVISEDSPWNPPDGRPVLRIRDPYRCWALICEVFYGRPASGMDVYAVTGTNGKTTIAYLLRRFLRAAFPDRKCGLLSTVEYDSGAGPAEASSRTTPEPELFQQWFGRMKENHCACAAMELSSHGLHQHRTGSLTFAGAVFTNLTGDHLDYHGTMENYYQAKRLLFTELLRPGAPAILNADDEFCRRLRTELAAAGRPMVHSVTLRNEPGADIIVKELSLTAEKADFLLCTPWGEGRLQSALIGEFNVCNLALAASLMLAAGVPFEVIQRAAAQPGIAPPGRLEKVENAAGIHIFVDYAHTDDALFRVLSALRKVASQRIITVFGCGGDRDRTKRPRMAAAAAELSDRIIVTSDNPRTEDPLAIIEEIRKGVPEGCDCRIEPDRAAALRLAVSLAQPGDIVLAAGKGHETYQEINGVKYPFDDRQILREIGKGAEGK